MKFAGLLPQLRNWLLRPRVVHRLPGRLRLSLPALKQLNHAQREWASVWRGLLQRQSEIQACEVNLTTGSMLIRYDAGRLAEAELLAFIQTVNRLVLRHWDRLAAVPPAELPAVLKRLVRVVCAATGPRLALNDRIEIPEHVWS
jgi:hypothetical protein